MSACATAPGKQSMRTRGRPASIRVPGMLVLVLGLALALSLAGCGVTSIAGSTTTNATPTATASATATAQATQTPVPLSSTTPCSPSAQHTADVGQPTYILGAATSSHSVTAHVGDTVQVRLPATSRWSFQAPKHAAALTTIAPSGVYATSLKACVWTFQANTTGAETLTYTGAPICKPGAPCAAYRIAMTFNVNVA